jgi:RNA polymerase sigma-70 factor, ECF subfamily
MTAKMDASRTEPADAAIVARVQAGESECFAELVRRYQPALARVAYGRLGRTDWAEDVVQETFLAAFRWCANYDPRWSFRTWLWTILLNQCHQHYQRRQRSVPLEPWPELGELAAERGGDGDRNSPLALLLVKERREQLELLLHQLSAVQAEALRLRFFGGLKFQEIAEAMECSLNTAKNRVRWGLMRMAELLPSAASVQRERGELQRERDV